MGPARKLKERVRIAYDMPAKLTEEVDDYEYDVMKTALADLRLGDLKTKAEVNISNDAEEKYFFRVSDVKFEDLYDFSKKPGGFNKKLMRTVSASEHKQRSGQLIHQNLKEVALFRYGHQVFAIDEKCPHLGGPLHLGDIETIGEANILCVVCPWHRWKIELNTGKLKLPQRNRQTGIYPVRVEENGDLFIGFSQFATELFDGNEDF